MINCHILGIGQPFPIDIPISQTVGHLKVSIYNQYPDKMPPSLALNQLKLWKYYIPEHNVFAALENIQLHDQDTLDDRVKLDILCNAPRQHVHILAKVTLVSQPLTIGPNIIKRNTAVQALYERLETLGFVQVRGTPASGKTTLASLLYEHIKQHNPSCTVGFITWEQHGSEQQWKTYARYHSHRPQSYLIVDEAQGSYHDINFWQFLKSINSFSYNRVILFCSYGTPSTNFSDVKTPMIIGEWQRVSLQWKHVDRFPPVGLLLQQDEFDDLLGRWSLTSKLDVDVRETIFKVTAGHVGAIVDFMTYIEQSNIYREVRNTNQHVTLQQFLKCTSYTHFIKSLVGSSILMRGVPKQEDL